MILKQEVTKKKNFFTSFHWNQMQLLHHLEEKKKNVLFIFFDKKSDLVCIYPKLNN